MAQSDQHTEKRLFIKTNTIKHFNMAHTAMWQERVYKWQFDKAVIFTQH